VDIWVREIRMTVLGCIVLLLIGACAAGAQPPRVEIHAGNAGQQPPGFAGIGAVLDLEVDEKTNEQQAIIRAVIPGTPADRAGLRPGDRVLEIDGEPVEGLTLGEIVERIRGEEGTEVKLTLVREGQAEPVEVGIVRDRILDRPPFPDRPGGMMEPMAGMMPQSAPVMLIDQGYLYILTGDVLYKLDADTLEQINAVHLMPPPPPGMMPPEGLPGQPPPPAAP